MNSGMPRSGGAAPCIAMNASIAALGSGAAIGADGCAPSRLCAASRINCCNRSSPVGAPGTVVGPAGDNGSGIGVGDAPGGANGRVSVCLRSSSITISMKGSGVGCGGCVTIYRYENLTLGANPLIPRPLISGGNAEYRCVNGNCSRNWLKVWDGN